MRSSSARSLLIKSGNFLANTAYRLRFGVAYALVFASVQIEAHAQGVPIPGSTLRLGVKTVAGWLLFVTVIFLAIRAIMVSMSSADERSKEERDDKIKAAWIAFGSGLAIFGVLVAMNLISLTDVQNAATQF
jgi:hypothetical protein